MASTTGFYGLQKLESGDALSTNDYAFTSRNVDVVDRLLHKFDEAIFSGVTPLDDPTDGPSLDVSTTGGIIPAGRTVRYKYTYVDVYGNETAGSPEVSVTTNAPVSRPSQPGLTSATSGGTLLAGNYFYVISAYVDVNTAETNGSAAATINVPTGTTNAITLALPSLPTNATGFNIFRRGPGEVQFYYLDSVDMDVATPPTSYVDDNSVTITNSRTPSATNLTFATNSISITLPGATPAVPDGYTWKVYRTFVSGNYDSSLLQHVVTETSEGSGIIDPVAYDYGSRTSVGKPPSVSSITGNVSRITTLETDVAAIEATLGVDPEGGYSDVAARLDGMDSKILDAWDEVWAEDLEGATPPTAAVAFSSVVENGSSTAATLFDGSQVLSVDIVGTDPAYVVKTQAVTDGTTVAYGFVVNPPVHVGAEETVVFRVDNETSFPGDADFINLVVARGLFSDEINFNIQFGRAGVVDNTIDYSLHLFSYLTSPSSNVGVRLEIDWAQIQSALPNYVENSQIRLYLNDTFAVSGQYIKTDNRPLDRAIYGSFSETTVAVPGNFQFDDFYIETKAYDEDKVNRQLVFDEALNDRVDPFSQYALRRGITKGTDDLMVGDDINDPGYINSMWVEGSRAYKLSGQIFWNAPSGEDVKFRIRTATYEATPSPVQDFRYTVESGTLVSPSSVGSVYTDSDEVILAGTSADLGVTILGSFWAPVGADIYLEICQGATPATPVGSTLLAGTWLAIESLYMD